MYNSFPQEIAGLKVYRGYQTFPAPLDGSAVAVGNFDGVHRGHQALLGELKRLATEGGWTSVVYSFRPHPIRVIAPQHAPPLLCTYDQKVELLRTQGVDLMVEEPFVPSFSQLAPEEFVFGVLRDVLQARVVLAGSDFRFGYRGAGNVQLLQEWGAEFGMETRVLPPQQEGSLVISSTAVRRAVSEGDMAQAAVLLGRPMLYSGEVVSGAKRGRQMGFPTANLQVEQELLPPNGVYAGFVLRNGERIPAVTNIGVRPTFDGEGRSIEAHLLGFSGELYGETLALELHHRLREEQRFSSLDELKQQIARDIEKAQKLLSFTDVQTNKS